MQKLKALFLLLLFCGYTVGSFATVHQCGSEITDIDILSIADCEHETEQVSEGCKSQCCHDQESDDIVDKDCCSTSKLSTYSLDILVQNVENPEKINLLELKVKKEYFHTHASNGPPSFVQYTSPEIRRDILIELQCFLI